MKIHKNFLIGYKVFFALLGFSALVTEVVALSLRGTFNLVNFFSFFTVQNNTLVVVVLLLSALFLASGKQRRLDTLRAATTVYILVVGIGFSFLLAGLEGVALTAVPWDNTVLHYIIPAAVFLDYLLDRPQKRISFTNSLVWLIYPAIYVAYSLLRGALTGWYPYPFLNAAVNGYGSLAVTVLCLFALGTVLIAIVALLSGRKVKV